MIVTEFFRKRVKTVQKLICSDPKCAGAVLKQRVDIDPTEAFRTFRIVFEDFEVITVIAIQAVPCSEPNEPLVVLNDIRNPNLREPWELDIRAKRISLPSTTGSVMVSVSTGESSEEVSARSPALAQATGTNSRTAKASSNAGQRPELKIIFDELRQNIHQRAIPQELRV